MVSMDNWKHLKNTKYFKNLSYSRIIRVIKIVNVIFEFCPISSSIGENIFLGGWDNSGLDWNALFLDPKMCFDKNKKVWKKSTLFSEGFPKFLPDLISHVTVRQVKTSKYDCLKFGFLHNIAVYAVPDLSNAGK